MCLNCLNLNNPRIITDWFILMRNVNGSLLPPKQWLLILILLTRSRFSAGLISTLLSWINAHTPVRGDKTRPFTTWTNQADCSNSSFQAVGALALLPRATGRRWSAEPRGGSSLFARPFQRLYSKSSVMNKSQKHWTVASLVLRGSHLHILRHTHWCPPRRLLSEHRS